MPTISFSPSSNNTTFAEGDILKVSITKTELLESLNSISITWDPDETLDEYHTNELRWSIDGINFSDWIMIPMSLTSLSNQLATKQSNIWFEFRFSRFSLVNSLMTLTNITVTYTELVLPPEQCPIPCPDPCVFPGAEIGACSKLPNACTGIVVNCDNGIFKPTEYTNAIACLYEQLTNAAATREGWQVLYFKVGKDSKTKDIILHEYTLYDVVDVKYVTAVVPDNEFPSEELEYNSFDVDFSQDFEIQITRDHFQRAFGVNSKPEQRDYLYFPLMDRIWEVHSSYLAKSTTMQTPILFKLKLFKWQDRRNIRRDSTVEPIVDSLAVNFEEVFREEEQEIFDRTTHPVQYKTIGIANNDHVRMSISEDLLILDIELMNYFTRISKNCYDLSSVLPFDSIILEYREKCNYTANDNLSFSCWWKSVKTDFLATSNISDVILNSHSGTGIEFKVFYDVAPLTSAVNSFELIIDSTSYIFDNLPALEFDRWYGIVLNISNTHELIDMRIWQVLYDPNFPNVISTQTSILSMIYYKQFTRSSGAISSNIPFRLFSGSSYLTNLRLWKQPIPEEAQSKILNQYIVKDSHNARMIDNALKPLIASKRIPR